MSGSQDSPMASGRNGTGEESGTSETWAIMMGKTVHAMANFDREKHVVAMRAEEEVTEPVNPRGPIYGASQMMPRMQGGHGVHFITATCAPRG